MFARLWNWPIVPWDGISLINHRSVRFDGCLKISILSIQIISLPQYVKTIEKVGKWHDLSLWWIYHTASKCARVNVCCGCDHCHVCSFVMFEVINHILIAGSSKLGCRRTVLIKHPHGRLALCGRLAKWWCRWAACVSQSLSRKSGSHGDLRSHHNQHLHDSPL